MLKFNINKGIDKDMKKEIILNKIVELNNLLKSTQDGSVRNLLNKLAEARLSCSELYNLVSKL